MFTGQLNKLFIIISLEFKSMSCDTLHQNAISISSAFILVAQTVQNTHANKILKIFIPIDKLQTTISIMYAINHYILIRNFHSLLISKQN